MYSVSNTIKTLLSRPYRQIVRITFNNGQGSTVLTESNVIQDSFSIDRYSCSNKKLEVGSAIASELTFQLKNRDGAFNNTVFEGAELFVQVGIKNWDSASSTTYWIPCGYFTVDKPPRKLSTISISALDRMMKFNRDVDGTQLIFPMTVETLVNRCCTLCGVTLASGQFSGLPNRSYLISKLPESQEALTYRTLIQWAAQIMGVCAFMDWDGKLRLQWYKTADYTVTSSMRYTSDMLEQDIALSGVVFTDTDKAEYHAGTDSYAVDLTGNLLIQDSPQSVVNNLWNVLNGFSYRPYTAAVKPAPYLYPMDKITFVDKNGVSHSTIVTNVNYKLNGKTLIAGTGETEQTNGYATDGGLTAKQAAILERMKRETDEVIASREQATLDLNEIMANALGLYRTLVPDGSGGTYIYYHNAATLDDSNVIYTLTAGGFATTDDWNGGNPTWNYGMSRDGNAVVNALSAYKITTNQIEAGAITADKIASSVLSQYVTNGQLTTALQASEHGILASVSQSYATKNTTNDLATRLDSAELKITDSAIISTVTSTTAGQNAVNSLIAQQANSIRLQASTIAWDSQYSSMSADGILSCEGANINGTLHTESGNGEWLDAEYGYIAGGESSETQDGRILFGNYVEGTTGGIMLQSNCLYLDNGEVYVNNPDDGVMHPTYTGTIVITTEHDGYTTTTTLVFVNGLLIR